MDRHEHAEVGVGGWTMVIPDTGNNLGQKVQGMQSPLFGVASQAPGIVRDR